MKDYGEFKNRVNNNLVSVEAEAVEQRASRLIEEIEGLSDGNIIAAAIGLLSARVATLEEFLERSGLSIGSSQVGVNYRDE